MKKLFSLLFFITLLSGCSLDMMGQHTHDYGNEWKNNEEGHWRECSCGEKINNEEHRWNSGEVTIEPTCQTAGTKELECSICKATKIEELPVLEHALTIDEKVNPTCTDSGLSEGKHCLNCNEVLVAQEIIPALGHTGGVATCSTLADCTVCGKPYGELKDHTYGEWEVSIAATLEKNGMKKRICKDCKAEEEMEYNYQNDSSSGIEAISIAVSNQNYQLAVEYQKEYVEVVVTAEDKFNLSGLNLYVSGFGATELFDNQAYRLNFKFDINGIENTNFAYANQSFSSVVTKNISYELNEISLVIQIPYSELGTTYEKGVGNFAFNPVLSLPTAGYSYVQNNPYLVIKYAETWLQVNQDNKIYYDTYYSTYANRYEGNWTRPSFANQEAMFVGVIKESTVEEAIVAMAVAEAKGAMGFDLHLNYLYNNNLLTVDNVRKIVQSSKLPVLALNYNSALSQEARLDGLLLAIEAGAAALDFQGFMYWEGSTINTQTAENIAYWENLGCNMSFVSASPKETVIDPKTVEKQKAFVEKVHKMGGELLMSAHVSTTFNAEQALAFAEFNAAKGFDVIKIVGVGQNKLDVVECVEACQMFKESSKLQELGTKVSFHLSGDASVYITRIICPVFYDSYVAFCWPELTSGQDANQLDLDMAIECYNIGKDTSSDINYLDAINLLKEKCNHEQLVKLINDFENGNSSNAYAFGASSDMSDRWTIDGNRYYIQLRDAVGTNSFNIRAYAYDVLQYQEDLWISATITGNYSAFASAANASSVRVPKVGVYIGDAQKMLALVYNSTSKTIDLVKVQEGMDFGYDKSPIGDRLYSTGLIETTEYASDVANGTIRLAMHKTKDGIELYFAENTASAWIKVAEIQMTEELASYFTNDNGKTYGGVLAELYMGSSSKGKINEITYNVSYDKLAID